jgi:hypothetical protein
MTRRRSTDSDRISQTPSRAPLPLPDGTPPDVKASRWPAGLVVGAVVVVALAAGALGALYFLPLGPAEDRLILDFARGKNRQDARADELLGPLPAVPQEPVSERESARLDAEFILRRPFKVIRAVPLTPPAPGVWLQPRFVLELHGSVASEKYTVRTSEGQLEYGQRFLANPDVVVEVRDGKIYGLYARLHQDRE